MSFLQKVTLSKHKVEKQEKDIVPSLSTRCPQLRGNLESDYEMRGGGDFWRLDLTEKKNNFFKVYEMDAPCVDACVGASLVPEDKVSDAGCVFEPPSAWLKTNQQPLEII